MKTILGLSSSLGILGTNVIKRNFNDYFILYLGLLMSSNKPIKYPTLPKPSKLESKLSVIMLTLVLQNSSRNINTLEEIVVIESFPIVGVLHD